MIIQANHMIEEIHQDDLDAIGPLIDKYREQFPERIPENFLNRIKESVADDKACVFGAYSEGHSVTGIALFGKVSKRINFVYGMGDIETEKKLVTALFDRFSDEFSYIGTGGSWIPEELARHIQEIGFGRYDRMYMTLPRAGIESLDEPKLPDGMSFNPYTPELREEISQVIFEGNDNHVDQSVFPEFFGTVEACQRLLENIEVNRYGEYRESLSWIIRRNGEAIGACFMTVRNGDMGYVPEIVINKEYRGKKLGKSILVHSMKRLLESDSDLIKVDLDVTLSNHARFLYESLGFTKVQDYTMYTWIRK